MALDEDDNPFRFVNVGDGPTRYTIVNFQKHPSKMTYNWQKVGDYSSEFNTSLPSFVPDVVNAKRNPIQK